MRLDAVSPVAEEVLPNHPDLCGFYFFPYELAEWINAQYGGFQVSDMDVEWDESSYAANAKAYPHLDYALVRRDTLTQAPQRKVSPFIKPQRARRARQLRS